MSYDAKVFNVMVASPSDVKKEREIIREIIYTWNAVNSKNKKIVLLPLDWESHSSPEMGNPPQKIINKQVSDKSDLIVGVFWSRIGTKTENYESGTVEEIEEHIKLGKPVMLYFSSRALEQGHDREQWEKLQSFKKYCLNAGLYCEYKYEIDFKEKFYHHLQLKINDNSLFSGIEDRLIYIENKKLNDSGYDNKIIFPEKGSEVTRKVEVSVHIGSIDPDYYLWLIVITASGGIYPQTQISRNSGISNYKCLIGRQASNEDKGCEYTIELVAFYADTNYRYEQYIRGEGISKDGLGSVRPKDMNTLDSITVIRGD